MPLGIAPRSPRGIQSILTDAIEHRSRFCRVGSGYRTEAPPRRRHEQQVRAKPNRYDCRRDKRPECSGGTAPGALQKSLRDLYL
jgi:hypothetical protein